MAVRDLESRIASPYSDETALRELFQSLLDSWGRGDGYAYGDHFTTHADYVAFDGSHTKGRQAIAESHHKLFQTWLKGTRLVGTISKIELLRPDVALIHATGGMIMPKRSKARRPSIQTFVAIKQDGRWIFTAFHNTRIKQWNIFQYLLFGIRTSLFRR